MIIDNFNLVGIAFAELESDAPALVDRHRPLPFAIALVQPDALQRAQVAKRFCDIHASNRSAAASKSSPRNWFGRSPSQTLRLAAFRQDLIMAITDYENR
ncbi:hypothetical protein [Bradyrhizobium sp. 192]|uniref:hypothetical protein n=1 Tax=Bradyrhizobium sp. 192 TaxID=2782660 RepID=UPI001FFF47B1|nr:hypothetical protein [Bradyrhizobium sp. 192]UPJ55107.1 hypothetical protein IVB24_20670 [Bradyrhizobium sp. 192]